MPPCSPGATVKNIVLIFHESKQWIFGSEASENPAKRNEKFSHDF